MSHYAKVTDGVVTKVILAEADFFDTFVDDTPGKWIKTSYNVRGGVYYDPETLEPVADQSIINDDEGRMRKNYAGIGMLYDKVRNAFYKPQPYPSWTLNEDSCIWEAPVAHPEVTDGTIYNWNEETQSWDAE